MEVAHDTGLVQKKMTTTQKTLFTEINAAKRVRLKDSNGCYYVAKKIDTVNGVSYFAYGKGYASFSTYEVISRDGYVVE